MHLEYEPLFNCVKEATTPTGTSRHAHDHGWSAAPENNGNASRVERPPRVQPDGTRLSVVEAFAYAAGGLLRESIDPDGIRSTFLHDSSGVLALAVLDADHLALTTVHTTDARGRVTLTTDPDGAMTGFDYDDRDNLILTVDALNHEMHHDHDREDRVRDTWSTVADDPAAFALLVPAPPVERRQRREYDLLGRIASDTLDPNGLDLRTEREYDPEGGLVLVRSPRATGASPTSPQNAAALRSFEHDGRGLVVAEVSGTGRCATSGSTIRMGTSSGIAPRTRRLRPTSSMASVRRPRYATPSVASKRWDAMPRAV